MNEPKERILRKTTTHELIERTFTTGRKPRTIINISRKGSIVKERCRQLTDMALTLYPDRKIGHADLAYLITSSIGGDRATIRAYMGYNGYVKHSTCGNMSIVLGKKRRGYLETFGFMHKVNLSTWVIHAQTKLIAPAPPLSHNNERVDGFGSKEKISLSYSPLHAINKGRLSDHRGQRVSEWETNKIINNNNTERERNFTPMNLGKIQNTTAESGSAKLEVLDWNSQKTRLAQFLKKVTV